MSKDKINKMREASAIVAACLDGVGQIIKEGIKTQDIDQFCVEFLLKHGGIAGALNYHGFPKSVCVSVNEEVCHGIPGERIIKDGDLVKVDFVVQKDRYFGDSCRCFLVGNVTEEARTLRKVCYEAMWMGITMVRPGIAINAIGKAIESYAKGKDFSSVRDYCGHGIGDKMHMSPQIPHFDTGVNSQYLQEGMFFTIEPMLNAGTHQVKVLGDNWTVVTQDHRLSAQWEHTIYVNKTGYEVLTLSSSEKNLIAQGKEPWIHNIV